MAIKEVAIQRGFIECDESYQPGQKSKGYRLTDKYRSMEWHHVAVTDHRLVGAVNKWRNERLSKIRWDVHQYLFDWLQHVEIDFASAIESLPRDKTFSQHQVAIKQISQKEFRLSYDDYGRVHTNLTNLLSPLRRFLSYKGRPLVNVDICNSQPLFLGTLFIPRESNKEVNPLITMKRDKNNKYNSLSTPLPLCSGKEQDLNSAEVNEDVAKYLDLVQSGEFYEHVISSSGLDINRDDVKDKVFGVMYGRNRHPDEIYGVFEQEFPTITEFMRQVKKSGHAKLAHMMQREESEFIMKGVCQRLMKEHPELFISTIHDSILTTKGNEDIVVGIMVEEFERLGIQPRLKIEYLECNSRSPT